MSEPSTVGGSAKSSRREFLKQGTAAALAGTLTSGIAAGAYAAGSDTLRIGLVGCGGRGTGAARDALSADPNTVLVAMGDVFADQVEGSLRGLKNTPVADRVQVDEEHRFAGFDAYRHVIDACDVVLLCEPPHFRPRHLRYAIEQGRHAFAEKPVAVDAPGVRSVLETCRLADEKGLSVLSGLCWRYHTGMQETFRQVHDGAIGQLVALQCSYNSQGVWDPRVTREQVQSDMEYQLRNWYYYTWLSGDFNVEQHIHSLDKMAWAVGDEPPVKATGSGGRQQRTEPGYGNIYDHFDVVYEYAGGVKLFARCRHWRGCATDVSDHVYGTKGRVDVFRHAVLDLEGNTTWRFRGQSKNMYQAEHDALFAALRAGERLNDGEHMCRSTLLAVMGRMTAYTGKEITWDQALNSQERLGPETYEWGSLETPSVAIPGVTPFV